MPIRSNSLAAAALAALTAMPGWAHLSTDEAIPQTEGAKVGLSAALTSLSAPERLPSQGLPGYLLLGDPGVDPRDSRLEHGVAQLGYRFSPAWGAQLALGAHGSDPVHIESAWLQGRGKLSTSDWALGAGRQSPSLGSTLDRAGHIDRFGLIPLAKQAVLSGDWIEDGAEFGIKQQNGDLGWRVDAGVWSGRKFPGASGSPAIPSLHLGTNWETSIGEISADAFAAQLRPTGRGSRLANAPGGHTHVAPVCNESLQEVVCFDGRSRVAGLSAQWESRDWPITLTGAVMWRTEDGSLQSRNGIGQYMGRTRGEWVEGVLRPVPQWELGLRLERLAATQTLVGPGAALVAAEAGFAAYAPQRRYTAMAGYLAKPWADVRLEWGRELAGQQAVNFVALRLVLQWEREFASTQP